MIVLPRFFFYFKLETKSGISSLNAFSPIVHFKIKLIKENKIIGTKNNNKRTIKNKGSPKLNK